MKTKSPLDVLQEESKKVEERKKHYREEILKVDDDLKKLSANKGSALESGNDELYKKLHREETLLKADRTALEDLIKNTKVFYRDEDVVEAWNEYVASVTPEIEEKKRFVESKKRELAGAVSDLRNFIGKVNENKALYSPHTTNLNSLYFVENPYANVFRVDISAELRQFELED